MPTLSYRWIAEYSDGETLEQPEDDRSQMVALDEATGHQPTAYRDIDQSRLVRFYLFGTQPDNQHQRFMVDLTDGHFEHNGTPFIIHPQMLDATTLFIPERLQLVYFREVRVDTQMNASVDNQGNPTYTAGDSNHYINRYFMGWRTNIKGKDHTHTIGIA